MANGLGGREIALFYEEINMLTLPTGLIKCDLFDEEIFQFLANSSTDSVEI